MDRARPKAQGPSLGQALPLTSQRGQRSWGGSCRILQARQVPREPGPPAGLSEAAGYQGGRNRELAVGASADVESTRLCIISLITMSTRCFVLFKEKIVGKITEEKKIPFISSCELKFSGNRKDGFSPEMCGILGMLAEFLMALQFRPHFLLRPHLWCLAALETSTCWHTLLGARPLKSPLGVNFLPPRWPGPP